jgi:hypothetical protein
LTFLSIEIHLYRKQGGMVVIGAKNEA